MQKIIVCLVVIAAGIFFSWGERLAVKSKPAAGENFIRLHVVANSNTNEDQALKRAVRDAIVERTGSLFAKARNREEAEWIARKSITQLKMTALEVVQQSGRPYQVKVELGDFLFPDKNYGSLHLPAGEYYALKVVIGSGQGRNWWCVLFPPLCLTDIKQGAAVDYLSDNRDYTLSKVKLKWKIAELLPKKRTSS